MTYPTKIFRNVVLMSRNVIFVLVVNYIVTYLIGVNFIGGYLWYLESGNYTEALGHLTHGPHREGLFWSLYAPTIIFAAFSFYSCIIVFLLSVALPVIFRRWFSIVNKPLIRSLLICVLWFPCLHMTFFVDSGIFGTLIIISFCVLVIRNIVPDCGPPLRVDKTVLWLLLIAYWAPCLFMWATSPLKLHNITYFLVPVMFSALFWFWLDRLHQKYSTAIVESIKVNL